MDINIDGLSVEEKKALLKRILEREKALEKEKSEEAPAGDRHYSLEDFASISGRDNLEIKRFSQWKQGAIESGAYGGEVIRFEPPGPHIEVERQSGERFKVVNFSTYNYLGYSGHPQVVKAAKDALDKYGLGATASPLAGGILGVHREFEETLLEFFGQEGYGISLFTSGYGALVGVISAYMRPGDCIVSDSSSHASIVDGMVMSGADLHYFLHNDMDSRVIQPGMRRGKNVVVYPVYEDRGGA